MILGRWLHFMVKRREIYLMLNFKPYYLHTKFLSVPKSDRLFSSKSLSKAHQLFFFFLIQEQIILVVVRSSSKLFVDNNL